MSKRTFAAAVALIAATAAVLISQSPAATAAGGLPDLGMARLTDLTITTTAGGQQQLRFSSTIVNVGGAPFQLVASRPDTSSSFTVAQRLPTGDTPVAATMVFAGDGHAHWHVKDLETYVVESLDTGTTVGYGAKGGFCFMDTTAYRLSLPGAPQQPVHTQAGCGDGTATSLSMGLSVGWGDRYGWTLSDQYVEITGIAIGKYRLRATADALGLFTETSRTNNQTWVDFSVTARRGSLLVKVLGYGPTA